MLLALLDHSLSFILLALFPFSYSYQITGSFIMYFIWVKLSLILVLWMLLLILSSPRLTTLVKLKFTTSWISAQSAFMTKLLSSFLSIKKVTLYLKVPRNLGLIWLFVPISYLIFLNIVDDVHPGGGSDIRSGWCAINFDQLFIHLTIIFCLKAFFIIFFLGLSNAFYFIRFGYVCTKL